MATIAADRRIFVRMPGMTEEERQTLLGEQEWALLAAEYATTQASERLLKAPEYGRMRGEAVASFLAALAAEEGLRLLVASLRSVGTHATTADRLAAEARVAAGVAAHMAEYPQLYASAD